jgi:hypothetical protein
MTVNNHAAPNPTIRMHSNHDCIVGSGALACQRSKAKAAAMETAHCKYCMKAP